MQIPSAMGLYFLAYLLFFLPWLAWKSARQLRLAREGGAGAPTLPSRIAIWRSTTVSLLLLGLMSWLAGRTFDYRFLAIDHLGVRDLAAAAGAMLLNVACFLVSRRWRTEEERKKLAVWGLVPRNAAEWRWVTVALLAAGVVEEIAYRGVGMSLLWWMTGSPWIAAALCAAAFAAAHAIQGGRSMLIVLVMALIAHGLVAITGTLVIAMVVHVLYDLGAVLATARKAAEYAPLEVS